MATSSGGLSALVTALILACVRHSIAQMPMIGFSGDFAPCEATCVSAFAESKVSNQMVCKRGCRLLSIADFMADSTSPVEDLRDSCLKSCKEAYLDIDSRGACAFGCQSQLPSVENHRKVMASYYKKQLDMLSLWNSLHNYYSHMMDCMTDHVDHQIRFSWAVYSPSGEKGQVTLLLSGNDDVAEPELDIANSILVEQKTANYLETNLAAVDRAATPNLKSSQVDSSLSESQLSVVESDGRHSDSDWLFCLERRTGASKKMILLFIALTLMVVLYFCVGAVLPSPKAEKLSISGDLGYLKHMDDKEYLVSTKLQDPSEEACPLPVKIPVHTV